MGNPISPADDPYTYEDLLADRRERLVELDTDHSYQWIVASGSPSERCGILLWHRAQDGRACGGYVAFAPDPDKPDRPIWSVESQEPLTISPSVLCNGAHGCGGTHGFIRGDAWVPA